MISASVLIVRVPLGQYAKPLVPDVARREEVPLVMCSTLAVPLPIREREAIVQPTADVAHLGRGEEAIDHDEVSAIPEALVFELPLELAGAPASAKLLASLVLARPRSDRSSVHAAWEPADDPGAELVLEVSSLVGGLLVDDGDLRAAFASRLLPFRQRDTLRCARLSFFWALPEELRGGDRGGTVAERGVVDQAEIDVELRRVGIGNATSGTSNSAVRLMYHFQSAARRNVALLVVSPTTWLWRMRTVPIFGMTTEPSANLTRWGCGTGPCPASGS